LYFEANTEPLEGIAAVGKVTLNRAGSPDNICKTVYEHAQFSWTLDGDNKEIPSSKHLLFLKYADAIIRGSLRVKGNINHATHYYADYIKKPIWAENMHYLGQIGVHKFYRPEVIALN
jgi:spore germination cell wall hydrolase CwlJ-like protein